MALKKFLTFSALALLASAFTLTFAESGDVKPCYPIPNKNQLRWQEMEFYAFIHFATNTFSNEEWGDGSKDPKTFNPTNLDCRQWARVCKEAGMKGMILTAKHHDGFCLWPSKYTDYSVKSSPWKDGKGDIVKELSKACKEYGLKLGLYLSPWDRHHAQYGKPEYVEYFRNQLRELLTNYGDIFEVWFDGANGGWGYYGGAWENRNIDRKTYYDWQNTIKIIRKLQPSAIIWNEVGPDIRWCGNEGGSVGETNWSIFDYHKYAPGTGDPRELRVGMMDGPSWIPAEVNTSIRPGWFYHEHEDGKVKNLQKLMDTYYDSIGRNGTFLLNFPIDKRGLIHENDAAEAARFAKAVREAFAVNLAKQAKVEASNVRKGKPKFAAENAIDGKKNTYWATDDDVLAADITLDFGKNLRVNRFLIQEYIPLGQRIKEFVVEGFSNGQWRQLARETTVGYKRILRFPTTEVSKLRLSIKDSRACIVISNIAVYEAPQILIPPTIIRDQNGRVNIFAADGESEIYYTLDGSKPTSKSSKYTGPIDTPDGKIKVSAIAYDPANKKSSDPAVEQFGISRKNWKILGIDEKYAKNMHEAIDGNINTVFVQEKKQMPVDIVIDMGKPETLTGFKYIPHQGFWSAGIITRYEFYVSSDNENWKKVSEGEFSNIKNNPLLQIKTFEPVKARYIKLRALENTHGNASAGYTEIDVITK